MSQNTSLRTLSSDQAKVNESSGKFLTKLKQEAAALKAVPVFHSVPHEEILGKLLAEISPVNFRAEAKGKETAELRAEADTLMQKVASAQSKADECQATVKALKAELQDTDTDEKRLQLAEAEQLLREAKSDLKRCVKKYDAASTGDTEAGETVKRYEQIVLCVEKTVETAETNGWPMCQHNGAPYLFNGAWWRTLEKDEAMKFLGQAAEQLGLSRNVARYVDTRKKLLEQFISAAYLKLHRPRLDTVLINLLNGTYEITGSQQKLREPRPADFLTYQLPFNYDERAQAPIFTQYLNKVQPDPERQAVLAEFLGSVFLPSLKHEKALLLYGGGANGKSVFFDVVKALFGETNVASYSLKSLTGERGANARAMLENKLLNYASEIGNGIGEIDTFKALVSGEPVEARRLYQDVFELTWRGRFIFNCNELPHDTEQTNAFFRRCLIVPFDVTLPEVDWDRELASKIIKAELAGVFNWVLAGLDRLKKQQAFTHSEAAEQAREKWRKASCSVRQFIEESGYVAELTASLPFSEIFSDYTTFCKSGNLKPVGSSKFTSRLKGIGIESSHGRIGSYTGTVVHAKK